MAAGAWFVGVTPLRAPRRPFCGSQDVQIGTTTTHVGGFAAAQPKQGRVARRQPSPVPESRGATTLAGVPILVVEDHEESARLFFALLTREGADVRIAGDAEEALAILKDFPARILIVDLVLPRMSGLLFVRQVKADPAACHVTVIAVSVLNGPATERLAAESGCAAYIRKPIDVDTFVQIVQRCFAKHD